MDKKDFELDIQQELEREIELNREKDKLQDTIQIINDEILNYIEKRKEITNYITSYRKEVIEEYRDDEDKIIEYFDHERFVKEEAFRTIDRRLKELTILLSTPYFGRVDFREEDMDDIESMYIGRFGVTPHGTFEPVVVDWRAPAAALFYTSSLGKASYRAPAGTIDTEVLLRRQYVVKSGILQGMFDSAIDIKDDILQMVLSASSSDKLKDIIMTIQEEQDNIIRQPREKTIVVNGVAGSGKTTIALHRVAYLLYNYREILQDKVLILGPNSIFMEYISTVLPSLGEVGVNQQTFTEFALNMLHINEVMNFKDYMEKILSVDEEFNREVAYKTSLKYKKALDELLEAMDREYFKVKDVEFRGSIVVSKEEIMELFNVHYKSMPLFRRSKKIRRILYSRLRSVRDEVFRQIQKEYKEAISSLTKRDMDFRENSIILDRKIKIRELVKDIMKVKESMSWLNNASVMELYSELNKEKALTTDDLAPILYLKIKLEGLKESSEIKHVIIDEAQDYSLLQFAVIKELTGCTSMTIVGDSNQRILPSDGEIAMLKVHEILPHLNIEYFSLYKSYRSTREIMEYANKYLGDTNIVPLVRSGEEVKEYDTREEDLKDAVITAVSQMQQKGLESIAVVCKDSEEAEKIGRAIKEKIHCRVIDREDIVYSGGVVALPSYFAKGLEFDGVVALRDSREENRKLMYVMYTRALHELQVLKTNR